MQINNKTNWTLITLKHERYEGGIEEVLDYFIESYTEHYCQGYEFSEIYIKRIYYCDAAGDLEIDVSEKGIDFANDYLEIGYQAANEIDLTPYERTHPL